MIDLQSLPNRKENEQTVLLLRRHWIVPGKIIAALALGAVVPIIAYLVIASDFPQYLDHPTITPLLGLFVSFYYLGIWLFMFQEIVDFYLDTWILTNERVIDVEQFGLFRRETTECHLSSVVDVTSNTKGILQTFLKYGYVTVQTAGEKGQLVFKEVPHPEEVRQMVLKMVDEDRARHERQATTQVSK